MECSTIHLHRRIPFRPETASDHELQVARHCGPVSMAIACEREIETRRRYRETVKRNRDCRRGLDPREG